MCNYYLLFLFGFTICLIFFNPCLASVLFPCTFASFCLFLLEFSHSSLMMRLSKLKFSWSSSKLESCAAVSFACLFHFRTSFAALATRALSSLPVAGRFLAPLKLTQPALLLQKVDLFGFIALDCDWTTFHKFMALPVPCIGHICRFVSLVLIIIFRPLLMVPRPSANLFSVPTWQFGCVHRNAFFHFFLHPAYGKIPWKPIGARRNQRALRVPGLWNRTLGRLIIFVTP